MSPSKKLSSYAPLLVCMSRNPKLSKILLSSSLSGDLLNCICECTSNLTKGCVELTPSERRKLRRHKRAILQIINRKTSSSNKKKIIQKGGFVGAILGPLIGSVLLPLAKKILS